MENKVLQEQMDVEKMLDRLSPAARMSYVSVEHMEHSDEAMDNAMNEILAREKEMDLLSREEAHKLRRDIMNKHFDAMYKKYGYNVVE